MSSECFYAPLATSPSANSIIVAEPPLQLMASYQRTNILVDYHVPQLSVAVQKHAVLAWLFIGLFEKHRNPPDAANMSRFMSFTQHHVLPEMCSFSQAGFYASRQVSDESLLSMSLLRLRFP